jgi:DNA-binding FrmR family transcriptional regulator
LCEPIQQKYNQPHEACGRTNARHTCHDGNGKDCSDVVTQLSAVRSSIDRAMGIIVAENLVACVNDQEKDGMSKEESVQQAINLLGEEQIER